MGVAGFAGALLRPREDRGEQTSPGADVNFEYTLRRSERAKNIRITVDPKGVSVVLPQRTAARLAHEFVYERRSWIERALEKLSAEEEAVTARSLADGTTVPYLDEELTLRIGGGESGRVHRSRGSDELRVNTHDHSRENVAALLERWYRRQAKAEIAARLEPILARNGTSYSKLAVRDQSTRWGSCSASGTLSFNWRLMLAPEHVLDYVIEHEAAHIEVRDHSRRFWALLDRRLPDWKHSRDWLRRNGGTLRLV